MKQQYTIKILPNGLKVLFLKRPEQYTIGYALIINAGSIYENVKISGVNHFFEHLLFTGTKSYSTEELLLKRIQELGFEAPALTDFDRIEINGSFPKSEFKNSLILLKEMAFESLLSDRAIEKERGIILEEERLGSDNDNVQLWNKVFETRFKAGNRIRQPRIGTARSISSISKENIRKYYKNHCNASNTTLLIAGDLERKDVLKTVEEIFGHLPKRKLCVSPFTDNSSMSDFSAALSKSNTIQSYIVLSLPSYSGSDIKISWTYSFLSRLLYEEMNKSLRINEGLVYHLSSETYNPTKHTGLLYVQTACDPSNLKKVIKVIIEKIQILQNGNIDTVTFERIRDVGNKTLPMAFDSIGGAINWCKDIFYYWEKFYSPEKVIRVRGSIIEKDLKQTAKNLFNFKKLNIVVRGQLSKDDLIWIRRLNL